MNVYIAIDIGGTQTRIGFYPENGTEPIQIKRYNTHKPGVSALDNMLEQIDSLWSTNIKVKAIGVAAPGPLDPQSGVLFFAPNIPEWKNLPLAAELVNRFHVPVRLGNDANLAAYGEWLFGAGQKHHHLIYLTISTGIGGGIICNDELLEGHRGMATELGHITVLPDGPLCGCGMRGHLESFSSGTGITRFVVEEISKGVPSSLKDIPVISARDISVAAAKGDHLARQAIEQAGYYLGIGIANFLYIFNPSIIIFGGGVSRIGAPLFDPMQASLKERIPAAYLQDLTFAAAALGDDAGLMGALAMARRSEIK